MTKAISRYQDDVHAESLARHGAEEKCRQLDGDLATARTQEVKQMQEIKHLSSKKWSDSEWDWDFPTTK